MPFDRTLRVLDADLHRHRVIGLSISLTILAMWLSWLFVGKLGVYVVSSSARLESSGRVHDVAAAADGRLVKLLVQLGDRVKSGDLVATIDPELQQLKLDEASVHVGATRKEVEDLDAKMAATRRLFARREDTIRTAIAQAEATAQEAESYLTLAAERLSRVQRLRGDQLISDSELREAQLDAAAKRDRLQALRMEVAKLEAELAQARAQHAAEVSDLQREKNRAIAALDARLITREQSRQQADVRQVRAGVAGTIASVANYQPGSFVFEGDRIVQIIPDDTLQIVGYFPPSVIGRLAPKQEARMRLDHPSLGGRMIRGRVLRVGSEPGKEGVQAIIGITESYDPTSYRHGIPGIVEVLVDRVPPARLILYNVRDALSH